MKTRVLINSLLNGFFISILPWSALAADEIPAAQARRIYAAAPDHPRVAPAKPRRVLIWNTPAHLMDKDPHKGYCIPYGAAALDSIGKKSRAFEPVVSGDLAMYLPENLRGFDAIVLNNSSGSWITPTESDLAKETFRKLGSDAKAVEQGLRKSLLDYVSKGGGVVVLHFAIAANREWPEFKELVGGTFTGHPWNEEIAVTGEEPQNPLLAAFGGKNFRIADEIYEYGAPYDRQKVRVLLSLDTERSNMGVKWINRKDGDFALAWVKSWGKGRVFNTSFGHRTELFWNSQLLQFYLDAIQFATGDLQAPTTPRADRPNKRFPAGTLPEVRVAKIKAKNLLMPTEEQIQLMQSAAPAQAPAKPPKARKVLIWGHSWTHEPNVFAEKALEILAQKTRAFQATISDDPRLLLGDRLPQFDALVLNNIHEPQPFLPEDFAKLDPEQQAASKKFDHAIQPLALWPKPRRSMSAS